MKYLTILLLCSSCSILSFDKTPNFRYKYQIIGEDSVRVGYDDMLYSPGDTVIVLPSKTRYLIKDIAINPHYETPAQNNLRANNQ